MSEPIELDGVSVAYSYGIDVVRDVTMTVPQGTVTVLLGPSGCGKTTLLRTIAGLERPHTGTIRIGPRTVVGNGVAVPPERRDVGMVFQDPALFPHLSVADNIAFGLRALAPDERRRRVDEMLAMVGLAHVAERRPGTLSGGQQQRVAMARSLAPHPAVLLLDEPFSALDAALRNQLRREVAGILAAVDITTVFVTHDQDEAFAMGATVGVLRDGRLEQFGPPDQVYLRPANRWVAEFVGEANFVAGTASGHGATTPFGAVPLHDHLVGDVEILLRPEALTLLPGDTAHVERVEYFGHDARYEIATADGRRLIAREQGLCRWRPGDSVAVAYAGGATAAWTSTG